MRAGAQSRGDRNGCGCAWFHYSLARSPAHSADVGAPLTRPEYGLAFWLKVHAWEPVFLALGVAAIAWFSELLRTGRLALRLFAAVLCGVTWCSSGTAGAEEVFGDLDLFYPSPHRSDALTLHSARGGIPGRLDVGIMLDYERLSLVIHRANTAADTAPKIQNSALRDECT